MTNAVLAIDNKYEDANVVTASTEATGYPKENAFDGLLSDYWQPDSATSHTLDLDMGSAVDVDCFGFYSTDLYTMTGATAKLYRSSDGSSWTLVDTITPTTASPKLMLTTSANYRYWRITFATTASAAPKIQHAYIGERLEMERGLAVGFEPFALGSENMAINSETGHGNFLGRSTKKSAIRALLSFDNITESWMRTNWPTLLAALESKPFMILTQPDDYTDEAAFCWSDGAIKTPRYTAFNYMAFDIPVKARIT